MNVLPEYVVLEQMTYSQSKQQIQASRLRTSAHCVVHSCLRSLPAEIDVAVSGLPCTDMSRAGKRLKRHGPTAPVYMTHAKYCNESGVKLVILECTPDSRYQ